jgi:hypothetical protein
VLGDARESVEPGGCSETPTINVAPTTRSMIRNGRKIRNPIWNAVLGSEMMNAGIQDVVRDVLARCRPAPGSAAVGVPRPERMKPRTMRMREKPVTVNSSAGMSEIPPISSRSCAGSVHVTPALE